jgi:hypothetical protein
MIPWSVPTGFIIGISSARGAVVADDFDDEHPMHKTTSKDIIQSPRLTNFIVAPPEMH